MNPVTLTTEAIQAAAVSLDMRANHIETGTVSMSRADLVSYKGHDRDAMMTKVCRLSDEQIRLVALLRALASRLREK